MQQATFLKDLTDDQLGALKFIFEFWALPHQCPPLGDWRTWVIMGGRGAGKTRAGAEWVRAQAEGPTPTAAGRASRIAIVGETFDQACEVMVFGESGLLAVSPQDRRPKWHGGRRMLTWPNGAIAHIMSAHDPDAVRGFQFDCLWADEVAKWKKAQEAWDMLQFALRLGDDPRACVTTTPRNVPVLRTLLERDTTVMTHAATSANAANLANGFMDEINARFQGTQLGKQEIEGLLIDEAEGAMWTSAQLAGLICDTPPVFDRVVVAVDPPVSHHGKSDACGIVVVGVVLRGPVQEWRAVVLEDASLYAKSPGEWGDAAIDAYHRHGAGLMIAEVNQGGALVESLVKGRNDGISYKAVHAHKSKVRRAEPIAAFYEQGRVTHMRGLRDLEDQMCLMTYHGFEGAGSPDRVDALVWALKDALQDPINGFCQPHMRLL